MMNKLKIISYTFLAVILTFVACRKDTTETTTNTSTFDPFLIDGYEPQVEEVQAKLIGQIVNQDQNPIKGATIKFENLSTTTDDFGHFFFNNVNMNSLGSYLTAEKEGYFLGSRKFYPKEASETRIKIQMIAQNFNQIFEANTGGNIDAEGMVNITFGANTIANADGTLYEGTVFAATTYLNPTENITLDEMPGDFSALNLSNELGVLNTYGMVNVELQDANGNKLNIAAGETALIEMNVPGVLQANAPSTIPLWSFNQTYGIWVEEGEATLGASKYTGTVSHFSWWNCDPFNNAVILDFTVTLEGQALPNVQTQLILANNLTFTGYAYTDSAGFVAGLVPTGEPIILNVLDVCGAVIYTQNIGPFAAATSLGNIDIIAGVTTLQNVDITGELLDCYGNQVQNGAVVIEQNGIFTYHYIDSNPFSVSFPTCATSTDLNIYAVDVDNFVQSLTSTYLINPTINMGQINVCGYVVENFVNYNFDGYGTNTLLNAFAFADSANTFIGAEDIVVNSGGTYDLSVNIFFPDTTTGSFYNSAFLSVFDVNLMNNLGNTQLQSIVLDTLNVTQFGAVGDQIIGNYSSTYEYFDYTTGTTTYIPLNGNFSALRQ